MRKNSERKIGGNRSNSAPVCQGMSNKQSVNPSDKRALMKVDGRERFDCATWLHKAKELPKEGFKGEVERHLTGKETEPWEIPYFKGAVVVPGL
jgi:hypothetical protein